MCFSQELEWIILQLELLMLIVGGQKGWQNIGVSGVQWQIIMSPCMMFKMHFIGLTLLIGGDVEGF